LDFAFSSTEGGLSVLMGELDMEIGRRAMCDA